MNTTNAICDFIQRLAAQTGNRPSRIEFPGAKHSIKINGVEVWGSPSFIGKIWLEAKESSAKDPGGFFREYECEGK